MNIGRIDSAHAIASTPEHSDAAPDDVASPSDFAQEFMRTIFVNTILFPRPGSFFAEAQDDMQDV